MWTLRKRPRTSTLMDHAVSLLKTDILDGSIQYEAVGTIPASFKLRKYAPLNHETLMQIARSASTQVRISCNDWSLLLEFASEFEDDDKPSKVPRRMRQSEDDQEEEDQEEEEEDSPRSNRVDPDAIAHDVAPCDRDRYRGIMEFLAGTLPTIVGSKHNKTLTGRIRLIPIVRRITSAQIQSIVRHPDLDKIDIIPDEDGKLYVEVGVC